MLRKIDCVMIRVEDVVWAASIERLSTAAVTG